MTKVEPLSPTWQLGHVGKGPDVFAERPQWDFTECNPCAGFGVPVVAVPVFAPTAA